MEKRKKIYRIIDCWNSTPTHNRNWVHYGEFGEAGTLLFWFTLFLMEPISIEYQGTIIIEFCIRLGRRMYSFVNTDVEKKRFGNKCHFMHFISTLYTIHQRKICASFTCNITHNLVFLSGNKRFRVILYNRTSLWNQQSLNLSFSKCEENSWNVHITVLRLHILITPVNEQACSKFILLKDLENDWQDLKWSVMPAHPMCR